MSDEAKTTVDEALAEMGAAAWRAPPPLCDTSYYIVVRDELDRLRKRVAKLEAECRRLTVLADAGTHDLSDADRDLLP